MARVSKELKIGIYFVTAIIGLYWGINFLQGKDIFGKVNTFYAVFDNVEGLQSSSHVYMKGLKVGSIQSMVFKEKEQAFVLSLSIQSKYNIPDNSVAHLYSSDIMGNKAIKIEVGNSTTPLADKSRIESAVDVDLTTIIVHEVKPLKDKAEKLVNELNQTFNSINKVLDTTSVKNLNSSISNLASTLNNFDKISRNLANNSQHITATLDNAAQITENLKNNNEKITNILTNFSNLSDSLASIQFASTVNELQTMLQQINTGNGSAGKLIYNDSLYVNLSNSLNNLDLLLQDFREHPKRYINVSVFGRKGN